jgi:hypothetical protein
MTLHEPSPVNRILNSDPLEASFAEALPAPKGPPTWTTIAAGLVLPLFFIVMFAFCYISAFHAPTPLNAPLVLAGQPAATSAIEEGIVKQSGNAFTITTTTSSAAAIHAVKDRDAIGAIEIGKTITVDIASGGGGIAVSTVERVGQQIAAKAGTTVTINDLAPVAAGDTTGTALFYFFVICTIGGYLTITVLSQVAPKQKLRQRYALLGGAAIVVPAIVFAISSIFVGSYGASVGSIFAMLAIGVVYVFTIGALSILANQLIGQAAIFLVMTLGIFLNLPSAGGAIPATFLPGFWQAIHSFWVGSAAMEPIRSIIYFGGADVWPWLAHLGIWLLVILGFSAVLGARKTTTERLAQNTSKVEAPAESPPALQSPSSLG